MCFCNNINVVGILLGGSDSNVARSVSIIKGIELNRLTTEEVSSSVVAKDLVGNLENELENNDELDSAALVLFCGDLTEGVSENDGDVSGFSFAEEKTKSAQRKKKERRIANLKEINQISDQ